MKNSYLKSDLLKVLFITFLFIAGVVALFIWDRNSIVLETIASKWF